MMKPLKRHLGLSVLLLLASVVVGGAGWRIWTPATPGVLAAVPTEIQVDCKFGDRKDAFVTLRNNGGRSVVISSVSSSCGCTVGTPESNDLSPGGETRLKIAIHATTVGQKSAVVAVAYRGDNGNKILQIPVLIQAADAPGTRVLAYPKDLNVRCEAKGESKAEFDIQTLEVSVAEPDLVEVLSIDERCQFSIVGVKSSPPDRNGKTERTYRIQVALSESEPFAATGTMRFRKTLAHPVGDIVVLARPRSQTKVIPSRIELPKVAAAISNKYEILLISEVDIDDWMVAANQQFPDWLTVEVTSLRSNISRLTLTDVRPMGEASVVEHDYELRLNSSVETAVVVIRVRS